jgi:hypothetical protein
VYDRYDSSRLIASSHIVYRLRSPYACPLPIHIPGLLPQLIILHDTCMGATLDLSPPIPTTSHLACQPIPQRHLTRTSRKADTDCVAAAGRHHSAHIRRYHSEPQVRHALLRRNALRYSWFSSSLAWSALSHLRTIFGPKGAYPFAGMKGG